MALFRIPAAISNDVATTGGSSVPEPAAGAAIQRHVSTAVPRAAWRQQDPKSTSRRYLHRTSTEWIGREFVTCEQGTWRLVTEENLSQLPKYLYLPKTIFLNILLRSMVR